jgi:hypothetical protein
MMRYPTELAFERAVTFADGTLAEWQLATVPTVEAPPHLTLPEPAVR